MRHRPIVVESLEVVDDILGGFHEAGDDPALIGETLFAFGAYVGEVIVRNASGVWVTVPDNHPIGPAGLCVDLPIGRLLNPIAKVIKRVANGTSDSIPAFYELLVAR